MLAVASVTLAPWCVAILTVPNGPSGSPLGLWKAFGLLGLGLSLSGLILGVGMSRSILHPIRSLIEAAKGSGTVIFPSPSPSKEATRSRFGGRIGANPA